MLVFIESTHYSCQILMKLEFSCNRFSENTQKSNFMKIYPVGAKLFLAGERTDRHDKSNGRS